MSKKRLEDFSLDDLIFLQEFVQDKDCSKKIDTLIQKRQNKNSINERFTLELCRKLEIFDPWEFHVLKINHIHNMQELIDCDLDSLIGITPSIRDGLEWCRSFYDLRSMVKPNKEYRKMK